MEALRIKLCISVLCVFGYVYSLSGEDRRDQGLTSGCGALRPPANLYCAWQETRTRTCPVLPVLVHAMSRIFMGCGYSTGSQMHTGCFSLSFTGNLPSKQSRSHHQMSCKPCPRQPARPQTQPLLAGHWLRQHRVVGRQGIQRHGRKAAGVVMELLLTRQRDVKRELSRIQKWKRRRHAACFASRYLLKQCPLLESW